MPRWRLRLSIDENGGMYHLGLPSPRSPQQIPVVAFAMDIVSDPGNNVLRTSVIMVTILLIVELLGGIIICSGKGIEAIARLSR
jgi:hypothetical protein